MRYLTFLILFFIAQLFFGCSSYPELPYPQAMDMQESEGVILGPESKVKLTNLINNNEKIWGANEPRHYSYSISKSCYCMNGLDLGPNEIEVLHKKIIRVTYRGEQRDGFKSGDSLMGEKGLDSSIEDLFSRAKTIINGENRSRRPSRLASEKRFLIEFDLEYGFPKRMGYDEKQTADEEWTIFIENFQILHSPR